MCMNTGRNDTESGKQEYSKNSFLSNTLSTTNPTGTNLGVTTVLCCYIPATKLFQFIFLSLGCTIFFVILYGHETPSFTLVQYMASGCWGENFGVKVKERTVGYRDRHVQELHTLYWEEHVARI